MKLAGAAQALGAYLWPRLADAEAADSIPEAFFGPLRRAMAEWPIGVALARATIHAELTGAMPFLCRAVEQLTRSEAVPADTAADCARFVRRLAAVPDGWARFQFEPRELATLGLSYWGSWVTPRIDAGNIAAAAARCTIAGVIVEQARLRDDEEPEVSGVPEFHRLLAEEIATALPEAIWPSFKSDGEHHPPPVKGAGHG